MASLRFLRAPSLERRFGAHRLDRLEHFLGAGDPLADAAVDALAPLPRAEQQRLVDALVEGRRDGLPDALGALESSLSTIPFWVDLDRASRGGRVVLRAGVLAGLVLGFKSLVLGYCSPAGNKPLVASGRLLEDVPRRLAETSRFFEAVSLPDGMARRAPGFAATVRVRLMHARIRQALRRASRWQPDAWGLPINQYDMAGTVLMFSSVLLDGLATLGFEATPAEQEDVLHLWRWVGHVMGVDPELLCSTRAEADALWTLLEETQAAPDDDSRALTHALIGGGRERGVPEAWVRFGYALCRRLVGPRYAGPLGLPADAWALAPALVSPLVRSLDRTARRVPGAEGAALRAGMQYWRRTIELGDGDMTFPLPTVERFAS